MLGLYGVHITHNNISEFCAKRYWLSNLKFLYQNYMKLTRKKMKKN